MEKHYCSCTDLECPMHPTNHDQGCDLCMQKNIAKKEMPTCMFKAVSEDLSDVEEYTIDGFVKFYNKLKES